MWYVFCRGKRARGTKGNVSAWESVHQKDQEIYIILYVKEEILRHCDDINNMKIAETTLHYILVPPQALNGQVIPHTGIVTADCHHSHFLPAGSS